MRRYTNSIRQATERKVWIDLARGGVLGCGIRPVLRESASDCREIFLGDGRAARSGFSLIEMLVALVVLSISLGVLYQAAIGATRNVRIAAEYTDAVMLAESMLVDNSYVTSESFSNAGRFGQYRWEVNSWPALVDDGLSAEERGITPEPLQYLEVVVSWPGSSEPRTLDLLTVVPLREPPE